MSTRSTATLLLAILLGSVSGALLVLTTTAGAGIDPLNTSFWLFWGSLTAYRVLSAPPERRGWLGRGLLVGALISVANLVSDAPPRLTLYHAPIIILLCGAVATLDPQTLRAKVRHGLVAGAAGAALGLLTVFSRPFQTANLLTYPLAGALSVGALVWLFSVGASLSMGKASAPTTPKQP